MRPDLLLRRTLLAFAGSLLALSTAFAAPDWNDLTPQQKALITPALKSQGGDFNKLSEPRRMALVKGADRWLGMSTAQRAAATQQFLRWQQMSTSEKVAVLEQRDRFRKLSPTERKALLDARQQFVQTPLDRQQQLRAEFDELQQGLSAMLPSDPFGTPGSPGAPPAPGTPSPLGLPTTSLPQSGSAGISNLLPH